MKYIVTVLSLLTLSLASYADSCIPTYQDIVKKNRRTKKDFVADSMVLGAVSSTVSIVSFGTGGPGLMLVALASYTTAGYLKGDKDQVREEAKAVINLMKDAKVEKGYYLQDATRMIRDHFQDYTITEKEVAAKLMKQDNARIYCKSTPVDGLAGVLMKVGKSIIAERALTNGSNVYDKSRSHIDKTADDVSAPIIKKIPSGVEDQ
jgi:hypothetical protein